MGVAVIVLSVLFSTLIIVNKSNVNLNYTHEELFHGKQNIVKTNKANTHNVSITSFNITKSLKHYICPNFKSFGRFGNKIFIYASTYGIARAKGMALYIDASCPLLRLFKIQTSVMHASRPCRSAKKVIESIPMGYSERVLNFTNNSDVQPLRYLQSWRYFDAYSNDLRKQLTIRDDIRETVKSLLKNCMLSYDLENKSTTLIGIHVRRGDIVDTLGMGKNVATKEYLKRATDWYIKKYKNSLFIVASDGMAWTKKNMPKNIMVSYLEGHSLEIDLATVGSCQHFIMTVGTFGWWGGWLTGGNVIFYKWPARDNTTWRKLFSNDYSDHYYPHWKGL